MAVEARCFGVTKLAAVTFCRYVGKSLMKTTVYVVTNVRAEE